VLVDSDRAGCAPRSSRGVPGARGGRQATAGSCHRSGPPGWSSAGGWLRRTVWSIALTCGNVCPVRCGWCPRS